MDIKDLGASFKSVYVDELYGLVINSIINKMLEGELNVKQ